MSMKVTRETDIVRDCLRYLSLRGIMAWRNNTGATLTGGDRPRFVRYGAVGSGDIFCVLPGGRFCSIECKRPGKKATARQQAWKNAVEAAGGLALLVTSDYDLQQQLSEMVGG